MAKPPMGQHECLKLTFLRIQESLKVIYPIVDKWKAICLSGKNRIRIIWNLIDEMENLDNENLNVLYAKFPLNYKKKLQYKLQESIDKELSALYAMLKELKANQNVIASECYLALNAYNENGKYLEFNMQVLESVQIPTLADMIEYITTLQAFFQREYQTRKIAVDIVNDDETKSFHGLKRWTEFNLQDMGMMDIQLLMPIFLHTNLNEVHFFEVSCI